MIHDLVVGSLIAFGIAAGVLGVVLVLVAFWRAVRAMRDYDRWDR